MSLFHANFYSDVLGMQSAAEVILPERPQPGRKLPTLYLLHGLSDDHTIWQRRTGIERYASAYHVAVVMPNAHRSFYTDMACGGRYFTYITEELPALMESYFPLSPLGAERFAAGLSMGGYGAFKCALNKPEKYAAAASLSGVLDICDWGRDRHDFFDQVFGDSTDAAPNNLLVAARNLVRDTPADQLPALYQFCGTEDFLYADNTKFRQLAADLSLPVDYCESPGGHEWRLWDEQIQRVLAWLPLAENTKKTTAIAE